MAWFKRKKIYVVHYEVHGILFIKRHFVVKATDISEAAEKCQEKESYPISILDWEILNEG